MDEKLVGRMLRDGKITAEEILRQTAAREVDRITEMLLQHVSYEEVRRALYERIGGAPLSDFEILKTAYFRHCARPSDR